MDVGIIALLLFGALLLIMGLGVPIAFAMGGISLIFGAVFWSGLASFDAFALGTFGKVTEFVYSAAPLYILMAAILRYSDLADDLYEVIYRWFGGLRGGLAVGTTMISSMFAAMVGIATVATATLGVTARPSMLKRGYDDKLTMGTIMAGGALGILIPPSVLMIIYAAESGVSAGAMFMGGILPGILAALIFIIYALIRCWINPKLGPSIDKNERFTWSEKFESLRGVVLPLLVIGVVLGSIYTGMATPTEAAAFGVVGALISAAIKKKITLENAKKAFEMTVSMNAMVFWIIIGAVAYTRIVSVTGVGTWFADFITGFDVAPWITLLCMQIVFYILGMFIDPAGILFMTAPLFLPVLPILGFDPVWYGVLFVINMCMAYMTPPFGFSLFVMRGVAPDVGIGTIYRAAWPFIGLYALVLLIIALFPQIVLWLPSIMIN